MKKILVVDDDKLMREGVCVMLREAGHEISQAENGKQGLEAALRDHPDLIIADIRMPEMDGMTMAEMLRQDEWGKNVPVIILTNDDTTNTINQALNSGVTVYLSKSGLTPDSLKDQLLVALQ